MPVSGVRLTVHVVASRRTVPGSAIRGARRTLIADARLRLHIPGTRLTVPGAIHIRWCQTHHHQITGARLAVVIGLIDSRTE